MKYKILAVVCLVAFFTPLAVQAGRTTYHPLRIIVGANRVTVRGGLFNARKGESTSAEIYCSIGASSGGYSALECVARTDGGDVYRCMPRGNTDVVRAVQPSSIIEFSYDPTATPTYCTNLSVWNGSMYRWPSL